MAVAIDGRTLILSSYENSQEYPNKLKI